MVERMYHFSLVYRRYVNTHYVLDVLSNDEITWIKNLSTQPLEKKVSLFYKKSTIELSWKYHYDRKNVPFFFCLG